MTEPKVLEQPIDLDELPDGDGRSGRPSIWRDRLQTLIDEGYTGWRGFEEGPITLMRVKRNNFRTGKLGKPYGHAFECKVSRMPDKPENIGVIFFKWLGPVEQEDASARVVAGPEDVPAGGPGDGSVAGLADAGNADRVSDSVDEMAEPPPRLDQAVAPQPAVEADPVHAPVMSEEEIRATTMSVADIQANVMSAEEIRGRFIPTGDDEPLLISGNLPEEPSSDDDVPVWRPEGLEDL